MKKITRIILAIVIIVSPGCVKEQYISHPYGEGKGNVTFYTDASILLNEYPMTIIVDGLVIGSLNQNYLNFSTDHPEPTEPFCSEANAGMVVNFLGTAGTHSFMAVGAYGGSSSGSFTVRADQCDKKKIHQ
ncbi:hypothetical protein ACQ33O_11940 [Ferruginibacter sp. SUN002]|uniref:hypothetical protein n=1 Tax=Ferruginibacter sp. SUN002 TaxID=2937789 RepID=UPI003D35E9D5